MQFPKRYVRFPEVGTEGNQMEQSISGNQESSEVEG